MKQEFLRNKWQSRRGITIVFALVIFLVTSLMSLVIVTSALNNANRVRRQQNEQQAMLAVGSAASYVTSLLDGFSAIRMPEDNKGWVIDATGDSELAKFFGGTDAANGAVGIGTSQSGMKTDLEGLLNGGGQVDWTMEVAGDGVGDTLNVNLTLTTDANLNLIVEITSLIGKNASGGVNGTSETEAGGYSTSYLFTAGCFSNEDGSEELVYTYRSVDRMLQESGQESLSP